MRAPVYRSLDAKNTLAGLSFPTEFGVVMGVYWLGVFFLSGTATALLVGGVYVAIWSLNHTRSEGFLQDYITWQLRRLIGGGRLSAAARARVPECPFGEYEYRDVMRGGHR